MKTMHRGMIGLALAAVLTLSVGLAIAAQHGHATAATHGIAAQHGHGTAAQHETDAHAHFDALAERLGLTTEQRHAVSTPFHEAFAAMQELHRLHGVIAAELTEEQKTTLADMIHEMFGASLAGQPTGR